MGSPKSNNNSGRGGKTALHWDNSDDSDLEDIVYEEDDSQEEQPLPRLDLSHLTIPTMPFTQKLKGSSGGVRVPSRPRLEDEEEENGQCNPFGEGFGSFRCGDVDDAMPTDSTTSLTASLTGPKLEEHSTVSSSSETPKATYPEITKTPFDDAHSTFVQTAKRQEQTQQNVWNFAMEHRLLVRSIMELLVQHATTPPAAVDLNDPHTLKSGPLKKATHLVRGAWKVKFVEIRRGIFSYFDDRDEEQRRKNIPLHVDTCTCRPVKLNTKSITLIAPGHAVFELSVEGGPRRYWMTNSRAERLQWIRAIQDAMIGSSNKGSRGGGSNGPPNAGGNGDAPDFSNGRRRLSRRSPYRRDVHTYLRIRRDIKHATSKQSYCTALSQLIGKTLNVPVSWITQQMEEVFQDEGVQSGVHQLYKDLTRDSVRINGELFVGGSGHAPERIIGALARNIMSQDRASPLMPQQAQGNETTTTTVQANPPWVTPVQSLSFARDILLSGNRTRSGGDSYYCVDALCQNPGLVVLVPSALEAEPLEVKLGHAEIGDGSDHFCSVNDRSGWLKTRGQPDQPWKKRYFVLSEGTLSYYERGSPRPHGLRGQIKVVDAIIKVSAFKDKKDKNGVAKKEEVAKDTTENKAEKGVAVKKEDKIDKNGTAKKEDGPKEKSEKIGPINKDDASKDKPEKSSAAVKKEEGAGVPKRYLISIRAKDGTLERQVCFDDLDTFLCWAFALEAMLRKKKRLSGSSIPESPSGARKKGFRIRNAHNNNNRDEGAATPDSKPATLGFVLTENSLQDHAESFGLDPEEEVASRVLALTSKCNTGRTFTTVQASVHASTTYNICTIDPQGDDLEDTWAYVVGCCVRIFPHLLFCLIFVVCSPFAGPFEPPLHRASVSAGGPMASWFGAKRSSRCQCWNVAKTRRAFGVQ